MKLFNIVKINDAHIPFQDTDALGAAIRFAKRIQPAIVVIDEWNDFYSVSRFSRDPERRTMLQDEINEGVQWRKKLRKAVPDSRIIELESNHMKRLKKYLWSQAAELSCLDCLDLRKLFSFSDLGIEYTDFFSYRRFLFKHGNRVKKYSGYTAKNEYADEGMSGASGHTHRLGQHYRTKRGGRYTWIECGCTCDLQPEYMEGKIVDWQHGIGIVRFVGDTYHYVAHPLPIIDGEVIFGD